MTGQRPPTPTFFPDCIFFLTLPLAEGTDSTCIAQLGPVKGVPKPIVTRMARRARRGCFALRKAKHGHASSVWRKVVIRFWSVGRVHFPLAGRTLAKPVAFLMCSFLDFPFLLFRAYLSQQGPGRMCSVGLASGSRTARTPWQSGKLPKRPKITTNPLHKCDKRGP